MIVADFNFSELEEGRFNVWNQIFTGDTGQSALFHSFFVSSKSLSQTLKGETLQPMEQCALCPRLIEHLSISLRLKLATSTAFPMYLRTLENGP